MAKYNGKTVLMEPVILPISDGAVGTSQLANKAVTTSKLENNSVTESKILAGAVSGAKLAKNAVTGGASGKIAPYTITKSNLEEYDGIPDTYTRIKFLRGTGTQYIDTGIAPVVEKDGSNLTKFTGFELVVQYVQSGGTFADQMYWFGAADSKTQSNNVSTNGINVYGNPGNSRLWTIYSNKAGAFSSANLYGRIAILPYTDRTAVDCYYNGNRVTNEHPAPEAISQSASLYLFALNIAGGSPLVAPACICQSLSITEYTWNATKSSWDSSLKADMVPVLDANGIPCMFDRKRNQAFYNAGTGQFLFG